MESRGAYKFKIKTPKHSPPQVSIPKKPNPIATPNPKVDFVDSSTQFDDTKVHLESHLEYIFSFDQSISSIDLYLFLIPNSQMQQLH
jgi:hypothetical protein